MAKLIRHGYAANETWQLLDAAGLQAWLGDGLAHDPERIGVLIPLALWLAQPQEHRDAARGAFAIVLQGGDDPQALAADLERIPVVAIEFARFNDGRGYSIARLLRQRYGYQGELRAIGDVLRDQLFYMKRVGFDAFELRADQDVEAALAAFGDFSETYQAAVDQPIPLFRRRAA
jgi:uncharacterized protein (DUF934 family)